MKASPVVLLPKESYLAMIRNSVGTNIFRNLYALVDGEKQDIVKDGDFSCAFFVSSILHQFNLVALPHATVAGLEKDLKSSGWKRVRIPRVGCVVVWEPKHIGFYIGGGKAISNDSRKGSPRVHPYHNREVTALYWNTKLK